MQIRQMFALFGLIFGLATSCAADQTQTKALTLPAGIKSFSNTVSLQFQPVKNFFYTHDRFWQIPNSSDRFLWGFAMRGRATQKGDNLLWRYKIYNHGLDKKHRECGEVEVITDRWGVVSHAKVLSKRKGCPSEESFLSEKNIQFPLCCLPRGPISMGTIPTTQKDWPKLPGNIISRKQQAEAVGLLARSGKTYLVIQKTMSGTKKSNGGSTDFSTSSYSLIDIKNGMRHIELCWFATSLDSEKSGIAKGQIITLINKSKTEY